MHMQLICGENEFPVYRGMAMIVLWIWCWAFSIHIWTEGRVNYLYMLELDPRDARIHFHLKLLLGIRLSYLECFYFILRSCQ